MIPIVFGKVTQAGPGLVNSAEIGPRRFVGVHGLCWKPPILLKIKKKENECRS